MGNDLEGDFKRSRLTVIVAEKNPLVMTALRQIDMRKISDPELQAKILRETVEATKNKQKVEEDIRIAEARSKLLLESEAQNDIEAYKKRPVIPPLGNELRDNLLSKWRSLSRGCNEQADGHKKVIGFPSYLRTKDISTRMIVNVLTLYRTRRYTEPAEGSKVYQSVIDAHVVTKHHGRQIKPEHEIHHHQCQMPPLHLCSLKQKAGAVLGPAV